MLVYEFEESGATVGSVNDGPARRNLDEARPKRMLSLLVDEDVIDAVFVFKWIGHVVLLRQGLCGGLFRCAREPCEACCAACGPAQMRSTPLSRECSAFIAAWARSNRHGGGALCQVRVDDGRAAPVQTPSTGCVRMLVFKDRRVWTRRMLVSALEQA